ncbi:MAG: hypothetical protein U0231_10430 [Nitrospiraceae bacterium]
MKPLATIMVTLIAPSVLQVSGIVGEPAGWGQSRPDSVVLQIITARGRCPPLWGSFIWRKISTDGRDTLEIFGPVLFREGTKAGDHSAELTDHTRVERRVNPETG